jgi:hypothetical protein
VPSVMPACVPLLWCPGLGVLGWEVVIFGGGGSGMMTHMGIASYCLLAQP